MNVHIVQILILSLALMHIHYDMELNLDEIINIFCQEASSSQFTLADSDA